MGAYLRSLFPTAYKLGELAERMFIRCFMAGGNSLTPRRYYRTPNNRRIAYTPADARAARFLDLLAHVRERTDSRRPNLLSFRRGFRDIIAHQPVATLLKAANFGDTEMLTIAIWLLGHCGDPRAVYFVAAYRNGPVRPRHVALALKRMRAWTELRSMGLNCADPGVQHIVARAEEKGASFESRLSSFVGRLETVETSPGRESELWMNVTPGPPTPPKSASLIRWFLERIHCLVHGLPLPERRNGTH
jgi:hypothetical protein